MPDLASGSQFDFESGSTGGLFGNVEVTTSCKIISYENCTPHYFEPATPQDSSVSLLKYVHVEDLEVAKDWVERMLTDIIGVQRVRLRLGQPGQRRWVDMFGRLDETSGQSRALISIADVDTELRAHESLARSEERFRKLNDSLDLGIFVFDNNGVCTYANEAFRALLGWDTGLYRASQVPKKFQRELIGILRRIRAGADEVSGEFTVEVDGELRNLELRGQVIRSEGTLVEVVGYTVDLTEQFDLRATLEMRANTDLLTGLANHNRILTYLNDALSGPNQRQVTLLFIDIDNFKRINEALGRWTGDQVLIEVSRRITTVAPSDAVIARLGGDEFVVLVENLDLGSAYGLAERIISVTKAPLVDARSGLQAELSVGIALSTEATRSAEELLRLADAAIFTAKRSGVPIDHANEDVRSQYERTSMLATSISDAINTSKLRFDYQPFLSFDSEPKVLGFEGLVRWGHETLGEVSASELIPLTTERTLIGPFTSWAFHQALSDASSVCGKYAELKDAFVTVNMSNRQLMLPNFLDVFESAVGSAGVRREVLALEVTETQYIEAGSVAEHHLAELDRSGVVLLLDDFGAGHSSLEYLSRVPFSWIKLDRGIVTNLTRSPQTRRLVGAMVRACRDFGTEVIAEGIETEADLEAVQDIGISHGQGYLFGRPAPVDNAIKSALIAADGPLLR